MKILLKLFDRYGCIINTNEVGNKFYSQFLNKFLSYGCDEICNKKHFFDNLYDNIAIHQNDNDYSNFCASTDDIKIISKISNNSNYYIMKCNEYSNEHIDITKKLIEEFNDDNCLYQIFYYLKNYNVDNYLFFNPEKTIFQQNYKFETIPIFKKMIYNNPTEFDGKSLSARDIYRNSVIYAQKINYNLEKINYTEKKCENLLPLYFGELSISHSGYRKYDFYDFYEKCKCTNIIEYLQQKDEEYYNYVNNL